jgi:glutamyl-tRNA reductase
MTVPLRNNILNNAMPSADHLMVFGIHHHTAPVALRERLAFSDAQLSQALQHLQHTPHWQNGQISEALLISTCNRTELYLATTTPDLAPVMAQWLCHIQDVAWQDVQPHLFTQHNHSVMHHLARVLSGLDSMMMGETQIVGQIRHAIQVAQQHNMLGTLLHQLTQRALGIAKKVRTDTHIGESSVSYSSVSVRLAEHVFGDLRDTRILMIGAGDMIEQAARHFVAKTPAAFAVANRTIERATRLLQRLGLDAATPLIPLHALKQHIADYDIVVSCTASSLPMIGLGMMQSAMKQRRHRPMVLIDLAVPRDIEPEVSQLDEVYLYTVDDLGRLAQQGITHRQHAAHHAEHLIQAGLVAWQTWWDKRQRTPIIQHVQQAAQAAHHAELERALSRLQQGQDSEAVLRECLHRLTNKLTHPALKLAHALPSEELPHLVSAWHEREHPPSQDE